MGELEDSLPHVSGSIGRSLATEYNALCCTGKPMNTAEGQSDSPRDEALSEDRLACQGVVPGASSLEKQPSQGPGPGIKRSCSPWLCRPKDSLHPRLELPVGPP